MKGGEETGGFAWRKERKSKAAENSWKRYEKTEANCKARAFAFEYLAALITKNLFDDIIFT